MGSKTFYIPEKYKKVEETLNNMGDDANGFILECILKELSTLSSLSASSEIPPFSEEVRYEKPCDSCKHYGNRLRSPCTSCLYQNDLHEATLIAKNKGKRT